MLELLIKKEKKNFQVREKLAGHIEQSEMPFEDDRNPFHLFSCSSSSGLLIKST